MEELQTRIITFNPLTDPNKWLQLPYPIISWDDFEYMGRPVLAKLSERITTAYQDQSCQGLWICAVAGSRTSSLLRAQTVRLLAEGVKAVLIHDHERFAVHPVYHLKDSLGLAFADDDDTVELLNDAKTNKDLKDFAVRKTAQLKNGERIIFIIDDYDFLETTEKYIGTDKLNIDRTARSWLFEILKGHFTIFASNRSRSMARSMENLQTMFLTDGFNEAESQSFLKRWDPTGTIPET